MLKYEMGDQSKQYCEFRGCEIASDRKKKRTNKLGTENQLPDLPTCMGGEQEKQQVRQKKEEQLQHYNKPKQEKKQKTKILFISVHVIGLIIYEINSNLHRA